MNRWLTAVAVALATPRLCSACAVCFGQDQDTAALGKAFNIGIILLLGVTFGLLGAGIVWFRRLERRRLALDARYLELMDVVEKTGAVWAGGKPTE